MFEADPWFSAGLVKLLLVRNPSERCTAEQAARHPFVARVARPPSGAEMEISVSEAKELRELRVLGDFSRGPPSLDGFFECFFFFFNVYKGQFH